MPIRSRACVAVVDLIAGKVIDLTDEDPIVPIPRKKRNYGAHEIQNPRTDIKPLHIEQPEGASFNVDGWKVDWQKWSFRIGFTPREGLVLHQLAYQDGERKRSLIHRASVTEMVVPYADPTANHFWKSAFDAGEYGLGMLGERARTWLRLSRQHPLFRRAGGRQQGRALRHAERHLHA